MTEEKTVKNKLNYNPSIIYKDKIDVDDPEIMRKIRYNFPLNVIDTEFDVPDVEFNMKDCPHCNHKNSFRKTPLEERFVRGLLGSFLINIDTNKRYYGRMIKKDIQNDLEIIYLCDNCSYSEREYDKFKPDREIIEEVEHNE